MTRLNWLLPLGFFLTACPIIDVPDASVDAGDPDEIVVLAGQGGIFVRPACSLQIPAGAFSEDTVLMVRRVDDGIPAVPDRARVSAGCRLTPSDIAPAVPLTIYMTWDPSLIPPGVDLNTFDLRRQTTTEAYATLPGVQVSVADVLIPFDRVEGKTDKGGLFWVSAPTQPNIARVELTPAQVQLSPGEQRQLTARVLAPDGTEIADVPLEWNIVPPRVASIDQDGLVTALDPGVATVTVTLTSTTPPQTATVSVRGETVGPFTFESQNPFPTVNDLHFGAFTPFGTLYAGGNGTVLLEADGGWQRVASLPLTTIKGVAGTSLEDAVAIGTSRGQALFLELNNGAPTFRSFASQQIRELHRVWFDGTSGLAIGGGGDNNALFYRNNEWVLDANPTWEKVLDVKGDGLGGFVIVGDKGSLYQWDPVRGVWDSLYESSLTVLLQAGALVDVTGEAWAVGGNRLWHFTTTTGWTSVAMPLSPGFAKIHAMGLFDERAFIVGEALTPSASRGLVLTVWLEWSEFSFDELRGQQIPLAVFGGGAASTQGAVWEWQSNQQTFREVSYGFQGDVVDLAVTDSDLFAAVNECTNVRCQATRGTVRHRGADGGFVPLGALPTATAPMTALVARADDEVLVATENSTLKWNGTSWAALPVIEQAGPLRKLVWCGDVLWAVGDAAQLDDGGIKSGIYSGNADGLTYTGATGLGHLAALHCPTPDEVWVAGSMTLASTTLSADAGWTLHANENVDSEWLSVWSPGQGEGFAYGDRLFGGYWNTANLLEQQTAGDMQIDVAHAVWGNRIDNLYMTGITRPEQGRAGFMQRFDGINWTLVDSGADKRGLSLFGRSTNEIWLGTAGGGILKAVPPSTP